MSKLPCSACEHGRSKCTSECVFAPYFPPNDEPLKFAVIHQVFEASNIANLLDEVPAHQRQDAVNSLYYEAEMRVMNPISGCVGFISFLQQHLKNLCQELASTKEELAKYVRVNADQVGSPASPSSPSDPWMLPTGIPPIICEPNHSQPQPLEQTQKLAASEMRRMVPILQGRGEQGTADRNGSNKDGAVTATGLNQVDMGGAGGLARQSRDLGSVGEACEIHQEPEQGHHILPYLLQTQLELQAPDTAGPTRRVARGPADTAGATAGVAADRLIMEEGPLS